MTKDEFMEFNELERQDILFMMATDDIDTALERWNMLSVTDENGDDYLEFDLESAVSKFGEETAKEMDEHILAYFAKREIEDKMNQDLADGTLIVDDDGNLIDTRVIDAEDIGIINEEATDEEL